MAKSGSAATILRASSVLAGPAWKLSIPCWSSLSSVFASAESVLQTNFPAFVLSPAPTAPATASSPAMTHTTCRRPFRIPIPPAI
jgi:hypothetical protein